MIFDDEFIENLPEDKINASQVIGDHFSIYHSQMGEKAEDNHVNYSTLVEAYSFLLAYLEKIEYPEKFLEL
ncbi:MAG: hypothetical protein H8E42_02535 [Nitrospinae bacterium]|nr:hypothetical protein [Nitrospinota bacterium]MBL7019368.1 hypothetical protein [Nitrospinaceae bacterium]